ncbi:MAG TPA: hypothetical protein VF855_09720, partial [Acidimicrobiales bacterium]
MAGFRNLSTTLRRLRNDKRRALGIGGALAIVAASAMVVVSNPTTAQAALDDITPFEIDGDTVANTATGVDWLMPDGSLYPTAAVGNDTNYTGAATVPDVVTTVNGAPPPYLLQCPSITKDTIFKAGTKIDTNPLVRDANGGSVIDKGNICQSFFAYDVIRTGPNAGHIIGYQAFTRRDTNGDVTVYYQFQKSSANPDLRLPGDIVIQVDYDGQGNPSTVNYSTFLADGTLGPIVTIAPGDPRLDLSPLEYFGELAIDLTALGLVKNAFDLDTPEECAPFAVGRIITRTGNSDQATLKDDGGAVPFAYNPCGTLTLQKKTVKQDGTTPYDVPASTGFPVSVTAPAGKTVSPTSDTLTVPTGQSTSNQAVWTQVPPSDTGTYT